MRAFALCLATMLVAPAVASAAAPTSWIHVTGAWASYSLGAVNDGWIADFNQALTDSGVPLRMNPITHDFGFGAELGFSFPSRVALSIAYDRLRASSEVGGASSHVALRLPANAVSLRGQYRFPARGYGMIGLGIGVGGVFEAGSLDLASPTAPSQSFPFDGAGALLEGFAVGEWQAAPRIAFTSSAGYRYAKVKNPRTGGQPLLNPDGTRFGVDYSGLALHAGIKLLMSPGGN